MQSFATPRVLELHAASVTTVNVGDLVAEDELERVFLVLADQVEEAAADVDITAWMREGVHRVRVQDCKCIMDVLFGCGASEQLPAALLTR